MRIPEIIHGRSLESRKKLRSFGLIAVATAALAGCASSSTQYVVAEDEGDYGYSERKLTETRYRVSFTGSSGTPIELIQDYALLRAAELTVQKNYDWFEVADRTITPQVAENEVGTEVAITSGAPTYTRCGLLSCSTTRYSPSYAIETVDFPDRRQSFTTSIEVVMGTGASEPTRAYDAREVIESVRENI